MSNFILKIVSANQRVREIAINKVIVLSAETGASYALLDGATRQPVNELKLVNKGTTLVVEYDNAPIVYLNHFNREGSNTQFMKEDALVVGSSVESTPVETESAVLDASVTTVPVPVEPAKENTAFNLPMMGMDGKTGLMLLGGLGLLGVGAAVAANNSSDSGGSSSETGRLLTGTVAAGRLLANNDLKLTVYNVDRSKVFGTTTLGEDGSFSMDLGGYVGIVIVEVSNQAAAADYVDETTGSSVDLGATLYGVGVAETGKHLTIQVNPLTTVAYLKSVDSTGMTTALVQENNQAIAKLFGLDNLHDTAPLVSNNSVNSFNAANGLSQAELYGAVLAGMSGMAKSSDLQAVLTQLKAGVTIQDGVASLSDATDSAWQNGITSYNTDTSAKKFVLFVSESEASIAENMPTQTIIYTASALGQGVVSYDLSGKDADAFNLNASTGQLSLKAPADYEKQPSYDLNVIARDSAGNTVVKPLAVSVSDQTDPNTSIVVFDLVEGVSSAHSGREFDADKSYTIYLRVSSSDAAISTDGIGPGVNDSWGRWTGANHLGTDDKLILVGSAAAIKGKGNKELNAVNWDSAANAVKWETASGVAVSVAENGSLHRLLGAVDSRKTLWSGSWGSLDKGLVLDNVYLTQIPAGILSSQGLV